MAAIVKGRGAVRLARSYILTSPWAATLLGSSGSGGGTPPTTGQLDFSKAANSGLLILEVI